MIPISADRPSGQTPVTWILAVGLVGTYAWQSWLGEQVHSVIAGGGLIPARIGSSTSWSVMGPGPQVMSLLTHIFLHEGWIHVLTNVWILLLFGGAVELKFGRLRFCMLFLSFGVVSGAGHVFVHSDSIRALVGASGAISGIVGAYLCIHPRGKMSSLMLPLPVRVKIPAWIYIALWFAVQCVLVMMATGREISVASWAHIIGFLAGVSWTWLRFNGTSAQDTVESAPVTDVRPWAGGKAP